MRRMSCFFIMFSLLFSTVGCALTIDAQNTTTCFNGYCETRVNLTKYASLPIINTIKATNLTVLLPKKTVNLTSIDYKFEDSQFIVYGYVKNGSSVYWTLPLGITNITVDPWWNYSVQANLTSWPTMSQGTNSGGSGGSYWFGGNYTFNRSRYIVSANIWADLGGTLDLCYLAYKNGSTIYVNGSIINNSACSFGNYLMEANTPFIITFHNPTGSRSSVSLSSPALVGFGNITHGCYGWPTTCLTNEYFQIRNITTYDGLTNYSYYYTSTLLLNGDAANISLNNKTALNITAYTNLTGLNVTVYRNFMALTGTYNGTVLMNSSTLPEGMYNITAFFGNASTNETLTFWANMSYVAEKEVIWDIASLEPNNKYCYDNSTLFLDYSDALINRSIICANGCDNTTRSCNPLPYQQYLIWLVIIVLILFFGYRLLRWVVT